MKHSKQWVRGEADPKSWQQVWGNALHNLPKAAGIMRRLSQELTPVENAKPLPFAASDRWSTQCWQKENLPCRIGSFDITGRRFSKEFATYKQSLLTDFSTFRIIKHIVALSPVITLTHPTNTHSYTHTQAINNTHVGPFRCCVWKCGVMISLAQGPSLKSFKWTDLFIQCFAKGAVITIVAFNLPNRAHANILSKESVGVRLPPPAGFAYSGSLPLIWFQITKCCF